MGGVEVQLHFLDLGNRWRLVARFKPLPLYFREKIFRYLLDRVDPKLSLEAVEKRERSCIAGSSPRKEGNTLKVPGSYRSR
jgi:hypothetical protein